MRRKEAERDEIDIRICYTPGRTVGREASRNESGDTHSQSDDIKARRKNEGNIETGQMEYMYNPDTFL